jgi:ABC-type phosphate transport system substrate-binding protein
MKCRLFVIFAVLGSVVPCFAHHMAVVVNKDNHTTEVTSAHLAKLFRGDVRKWVDGRDVVLVLHNANPGETETLQHLTRMSGKEMKDFIAAHKESVVTLDSDADVLKAVEDTPGAVGMVDVRAINDRVNVLKVDGKLPLETGYLPH